MAEENESADTETAEDQTTTQDTTDQQTEKRDTKQQDRTGTDGGADKLQAQIDKLTEDLSKWKAQSRKHESQAKQNAEAAKEKQTVEEQLTQLREQMAARDAADVADKAELAGERLQAQLVRGGLSDDDATTLVGTIDVYRLLEEGKPDGKEIDRLAKSLLKIGTRQTPDRDQGRKGGEAPPTMSELIRDAARRNNVVG